MREIKFRGKRTDNGEWVEGDLTRYSEHISYITVDLIESEAYQVLTSTVGQCTGLKDKNGKKIYEGDILRYTWNKKECIDVIVFEPPMFTYRNAIRWDLNEDEVIGNIYENPELLEKEG